MFKANVIYSERLGTRGRSTVSDKDHAFFLLGSHYLIILYLFLQLYLPQSFISYTFLLDAIISLYIILIKF